MTNANLSKRQTHRELALARLLKNTPVETPIVGGSPDLNALAASNASDATLSQEVSQALNEPSPPAPNPPAQPEPPAGGAEIGSLINKVKAQGEKLDSILETLAEVLALLKAQQGSSTQQTGEAITGQPAPDPNTQEHEAV